MSTEGRWHLYRLLAEPTRVRLIALVAEAELTIGELSELLEELQPNVSRHATALRQGGVLLERRQGTRTFLRLSSDAWQDVVVRDALEAGKRMCLEEGRLERIASVLRTRETQVKPSGDVKTAQDDALVLARELPAYVFGLSRVVAGLDLAVDVATGDGGLLDVLAPFFRRVIAFERRQGHLERAKRRVNERGYQNVELLHGSVEERDARIAVGEGACAVFVNRVLSNVAAPRVTLASFVALLRSGGTLVLFELAASETEISRERRTEPKKGYSVDELWQLAQSFDLASIEITPIAPGLVRGGLDSGAAWLMLTAIRSGNRIAASADAQNI